MFDMDGVVVIAPSIFSTDVFCLIASYADMIRSRTLSA